MRHAARSGGGFARRALLVWLASVALAQAEDVTTLSGTTFHNVRLVRVQPDGVVWQHSTGMVMVNFTDLPETLRQQYHYDAGKAATFLAAQGQEREKVAAQAQQAQREVAAHRAQRFEQMEAASAAGTDGKLGTFVNRRERTTESLVQSTGEQIAAKKQAEAKFHEDDGTIWDRRIWAIPRLITGGYSDGHAFDPSTQANPQEFQNSAHHAPGGFAVDSAHDSFFQPDYMTKSYSEDLDHAAAFTGGKP